MAAQAAADAAANAAKTAGNTAMSAGSWVLQQFTTKLPRTVLFAVAAVGGAKVIAAMKTGQAFFPAVATTTGNGLTEAWEGTKTVVAKAYDVGSHVDWKTVGSNLMNATDTLTTPVPAPAG